MIVVVIVAVCVVFAVGTCFILYQLGVVPSAPGAPERQSWFTERTAGARTPLQAARRGDREWPQGCLIGILVGAAVWFLLWGLVLILALRVLSNPFG
ncbi:MAG TPA: hypothetical protein VK988_22640 [Acidimicrobiales bacterium]|nr:hypothetical protein [Acidimicrobiales bacterium]